MTVVAWTTLARLEARFGASRVRQYLDHDGDGNADAALVAAVCDDANGELQAALLKKNYSAADLELLVDDPWLIRRGCEIGIAYAGESRPEWLNQLGQGPFEAFRVNARKLLRDMALGELRVPTETATATRRNVSGEIGQGPGFVIAESDDDPTGPGGF